MRFKTSVLALALAAAGVGIAALSSTAHAQYPPTSTASVTVAASTTTTSAGSTVTIAAVAEDATGTRQDGVLCSFSIESQPGNDAELQEAAATTNENGVASTQLYVGSTQGDIVVASNCGGVSGETTVVAGATTSPTELSEGSPSNLPSTGMGTRNSNSNLGALLLLGTILATAGVAGLYAGRRS